MSELSRLLRDRYHGVSYVTRQAAADRLDALEILLTRWMDEHQPRWRETAALGDDNPGNYFASMVQADTAKALVGKQ